MALATFPDGSTPEVIEVVRAVTFLFAGGQGTSARFLGNMVICSAKTATSNSSSVTNAIASKSR